MLRDKGPSTKEDLLTAFWESWNQFDKEYYFKLVKELRLSYVFLFFDSEFHNFFLNSGSFHDIFLCVAWKNISVI